MWNRNQDDPQASTSTPSQQPTAPATTPPAPASAGRAKHQAAVIGPSISIKGDLTGEEDLIIEGKVEGEVTLEQHKVVIGGGGRVKANVKGQKIHVEGEVEGDLVGEQEVVIRKTGRVTGNITAPRVTLEDGCKFRGNVDMNPRPQRQAKAGPVATAAASARQAGKPGAPRTSTAAKPPSPQPAPATG